MGQRVIFLCTGNICRSPLAEVIAGKLFRWCGLDFASAGLDAVPGLPASVSSVEYAARHGLNLAGHQSQPVTAALLRGTDWFIGMTRGHAAIFRSRYGNVFAGAIGVLGAPGLDLAVELSSPVVEEVSDPYGMPQASYFTCGDQITRLLGNWSDVFTNLPSDGGATASSSRQEKIMKIAVGSDHRGFAHKALITRILRERGLQVEDFGCPGTNSADYPDAALPAAEMVARREACGGILICGSGIGMSIAANKVKGIRASLCFDEDQARTTRQHNDSNVLCLSGDAISPEAAGALAVAWLDASFEGGRHARRVAKITNYEDNHMIGTPIDHD